MSDYVKDSHGLERLLCPSCGAVCDAEYVDIGVGNQRCEPWSCPDCGWIDPPADEDFELIEAEDWEPQS